MNMDIISPASPMATRLDGDVHKAATVFLSHVRRSFQRFPTDYTGELVRLLDDIAVVTRSVSAAADGSSPSAASVTETLYKGLQDGYCCVILSKGTDQPLTFPDDIPHGNYVVCVSPLDYDTSGVDSARALAGTTFSVYKRRSSVSLPGRGIDLKQAAGDQVAAGYCCYSSATTLFYTMGHGVYSFVLQPVTKQYFLQPSLRLSIPESSSNVYCQRELFLGESVLSNALKRAADRHRTQTFTTGCLISDLHMVLQSGGLLVAENVHFLCEAAPIALIIEQAGGVAYDGRGTRILELKIEEDHNRSVTIVAGSSLFVRNLEIGAMNGNGNGNGNTMSAHGEAIAALDA